MGKSLVIDASIARSCGDEKATYPTSGRCRDFLIETQASQHRIVIKAEWEKHRSRFASQWLGSMIARKQFTRISNLPIDPDLWDPIEKLAKDDGERAAMTIMWVNPDKPEETPIEWLQAGAPADEFRMLGNGLK
jgi:hypothetical protein